MSSLAGPFIQSGLQMRQENNQSKRSKRSEWLHKNKKCCTSRFVLHYWTECIRRKPNSLWGTLYQFTPKVHTLGSRNGRCRPTALMAVPHQVREDRMKLQQVSHLWEFGSIFPWCMSNCSEIESSAPFIRKFGFSMNQGVYSSPPRAHCSQFLLEINSS